MAKELGAVSETLYVPLAGRIYARNRFPDIFSDEKLSQLEEKIKGSVDVFKGQTEYTFIVAITEVRIGLKWIFLKLSA